jgi:hypothetical protein
MKEFMSNNKDYQIPGFSKLQIHGRAPNSHKNISDSDSLKNVSNDESESLYETVWLVDQIPIHNKISFFQKII